MIIIIRITMTVMLVVAKVTQSSGNGSSLPDEPSLGLQRGSIFQLLIHMHPFFPLILPTTN